jgi:tetratricopeptide (TPR) repeat protein
MSAGSRFAAATWRIYCMPSLIVIGNTRVHLPETLAAGYLEEARKFAELGRIDDAEIILRDAIKCFPDKPDLLLDYAKLAERSQDWPEVAARWRTARLSLPERWFCYVGEAWGLRELSRWDEAEEVLREAIDRFPDEPAPALDYARIAHIRREHETAVHRWEGVRRRFPQEITAYTFAALDLCALDRGTDAEELLRDATIRFPDDPQPLIDYARVAERGRDWAEAARRWQDVRHRFPGRIEGYIGLAASHTRAGCHEQAEDVMTAAIVHFPDEPHIAGDYAWVAYRRHRWDEAESRFAEVRVRFPEEPTGYLGGAAVLASKAALSESEALLELGMERVPGNARIAFDHALLPASPLLRESRDWDTTIERLKKLCEKFPDFEPGLVATARILKRCCTRQ